MAEETIDPSLLEQTKNQIKKLVAEIAELAESDAPPNEFHSEFLNRVVAAVAASGGALWLLDGKGALKLQHQMEFRLSGLLDGRVRTQPHDALLACMLQSSQAQIIPPGAVVEGMPNAGNPTPFTLILAPLVLDKQVVGLVEILMDPTRRAASQKSTQRFIGDLCDLAVRYLKNRQMRQMMAQQQLWNQIEGYSHAIHSSLSLKETAYAVVNDGKRLTGCDRMNVTLKLAGRVAVEAVSGQEVVEQRSNLIRELNKLCKAVIASGEDLIYTGETESFPPEIRDALEIYVDESGAKGVLITLLHKPEPDPSKERVAFGCLVAEQIGDDVKIADVQPKIDVIARHASAALWNAQEYDRIFLLPLLRSVGSQMRVFRGRTWAKIGAVAGLIVATILAMALVPWTLTIQGDGALMPEQRRTIYAPQPGCIVSEVLVEHGQHVNKGDVLLRLSNRELDKEQKRLLAEANSATTELDSLNKQLSDSRTRFDERPQVQSKLQEAKIRKDSAEKQIEVVRHQIETLEIKAPQDGIITTWEVKKNLLNRPVEHGQDLLTIADPEGEIRLEVQVPDDDMAPVLEAREKLVDQMNKRVLALDEILKAGTAGTDGEAYRLEHDILTRELKLAAGGLSDEEFESIRSESATAKSRLREMGKPVPVTRIPAYFVTATDPSHRYSGEVLRIATKAELVEQVVVTKVTVGFTKEVRDDFLTRNQEFRPGAGVRAGIKCGQARLAYCLFRDVVHVWYETVLFRWPFL